MNTQGKNTRDVIELSQMFSDQQIEILNILWTRGSATSREAWEAMGEEPTYRSVLAAFQSLEETGYVQHESEPDGDAVRFHPTVSRKKAERQAVDHLLRRLFRESPAMMIEALLPREEDPIAAPGEREANLHTMDSALDSAS